MSSSSVLGSIGGLGLGPGPGPMDISSLTLNIPKVDNLQDIINGINSGTISNLNDLKQYSLTLNDYTDIQNKISKNVFKQAINTFITTAQKNLASMSNYALYNEPIVIEHIFNKNYNRATKTFNKDAFFKEIEAYILNIPNDPYKQNSIYEYVVNYSQNNFYFLTIDDLIYYQMLPSANVPIINSSTGDLNTPILLKKTSLTRQTVPGLNRYTAHIFLMNIYRIIDNTKDVFTFIQNNTNTGKTNKSGHPIYQEVSFNLETQKSNIATFLGFTNEKELMAALQSPLDISYMFPASGSSGGPSYDNALINAQYNTLITRGINRGDICLKFAPSKDRSRPQAYIKLAGCNAGTKVNPGVKGKLTPKNFVYDYINFHLSIKQAPFASGPSSGASLPPRTSLPKIQHPVSYRTLKGLHEHLHFTNTVGNNPQGYHFYVYNRGKSSVKGGANHKHKTRKHKTPKHKRRTYRR